MSPAVAHHPQPRNHRSPELACPLPHAWEKLGPALRVECWGQADAALAELGRVNKLLAGLAERQQRALKKAEAAAARAAQGLESRRAKLAAALEKFCRRHQPELARVNGHSRRSRRLLFGRVGYRASQAVVVRSEAAALRTLAHWRAGQQFLRVRTELDREALRQFLLHGQGLSGLPGQARRRLRRAGIELDVRQNWFYELDRRALARWG